MHLPVNNWANVMAEHTIAEPIAETNPPRAIVYVREIRSATGPDTADEIEAVMRIEDTINPCTVGVS